MCGRYIELTEEDIYAMREIVMDVQEQIYGRIEPSPYPFITDVQSKQIAQSCVSDYNRILEETHKTNHQKFDLQFIEYGIVSSSKIAPVMYAAPDNSGKLICEPMKFGFPKPDYLLASQRFPGDTVVLNARSEKITSTSMFSDSVLSRRCLIPVMGYFERRRSKPYGDYYHVSFSSQLMFLAGVYKIFRDDELGIDIPHFSIITCHPPQQEVFYVHDRMPFIIDRKDSLKWLFCGNTPNSVNSFIVSSPIPYMFVQPWKEFHKGKI